MAVRINEGDKVHLKVGDEEGGWGIVKLIQGDKYYVAPYNGSDERLFSRKEISKPRHTH